MIQTMGQKFVVRFVPVMFLAWATLGTLVAQVSTAGIVGTASDATQAVVVGVKITATNLATGVSYSTSTNDRGDYSIPLLPNGQYRVQAEMLGFKVWSIPSVTLSVGDRKSTRLNSSHLKLSRMPSSA